MPDRLEIFEKLPDGVTLHDANDGSIIRANDQFCELLGYSGEELRHLDFNDLHPDEPPYTSERAREYFRKAATEGPQTFEWMDVTSNGDRLPVEVNLRYATIDGEDRIIAVVRDISKRRRRQRELERRNQQLEDFASVVSHDLRNPLNVIEGRVQLAREKFDSDHLDAIANAAGRMNELIDDLLSLAREGNNIGEMETVILESVAADCWQNVETDDATLIVETSGSLIADQSLLRQLLENLFRNAIEHGGSGVAITIGTCKSGDGIYVEDTGPGIPADNRDRVFDAGFSTAENGTGFGLTIVKEIAEAHDWEVNLVDGKSGATRFEITGVEFTA